MEEATSCRRSLRLETEVTSMSRRRFRETWPRSTSSPPPGEAWARAGGAEPRNKASEAAARADARREFLPPKQAKMRVPLFEGICVQSHHRPGPFPDQASAP